MDAALPLYRPGNGTAGDLFMARFCDRCERDRDAREETGPGCMIIARTLVFDVDDPNYPREWRYGADGRPTCTAFVPDGQPIPIERELEAAGQQTLFQENPS